MLGGVLLIEHTSREFISSRMQLGSYLTSLGYHVSALIPECSNEERKLIESNNIRVFTYQYRRNSLNIFHNIRLVFHFAKIFRRNNFSIIHSFKFQPNFYASLAILWARSSNLVLHITGLGIAFTKCKGRVGKLKILRFLSRCIFAYNLMVCRKMIFQNPDDPKDLWLTDLYSRKISVIPGSGVNVAKFHPNREPEDEAIIKLADTLDGRFVLSFISRLIVQKGILDILEAMSNLENKNIHLVIAGEMDDQNPGSISKDDLSEIEKRENIHYLGFCDNVDDIYAISDLYIFPSYYREGIPRTLLEALSSGLPVIVADVPGCRMAVVDGRNGILVPPRNPERLRNAILELYKHEDIGRMGIESRKLAETLFSTVIVNSMISEVYSSL